MELNPLKFEMPKAVSLRSIPSVKTKRAPFMQRINTSTSILSDFEEIAQETPMAQTALNTMKFDLQNINDDTTSQFSNSDQFSQRQKPTSGQIPHLRFASDRERANFEASTILTQKAQHLQYSINKMQQYVNAEALRVFKDPPFNDTREEMEYNSIVKKLSECKIKSRENIEEVEECMEKSKEMRSRFEEEVENRLQLLRSEGDVLLRESKKRKEKYIEELTAFRAFQELHRNCIAFDSVPRHTLSPENVYSLSCKFAYQWPPPFEHYFSGMSKVKMDKKKSVLPQKLVGIIYDIYEKKIFADSVDDRECNPRQSLPAFVREYLSNKFGLAKLSEAHLLGILDAVREAEEEVTKNGQTFLAPASSVQGLRGDQRRVMLFGLMCGIVRPEYYNPRLCDLFLNILSQCVHVKRTQEILNNYPDGDLFVLRSQLMVAIDNVFPTSRVSFAIDKIELEENIRERLLKEIDNLTLPPIPPNARKKKARVGPRRQGLLARESIVDLDGVLQVCLLAWIKQTEIDLDNLEVLFDTISQANIQTIPRSSSPNTPPLDTKKSTNQNNRPQSAPQEPVETASTHNQENSLSATAPAADFSSNIRPNTANLQTQDPIKRNIRSLQSIYNNLIRASALFFDVDQDEAILAIDRSVNRPIFSKKQGRRVKPRLTSIQPGPQTRESKISVKKLESVQTPLTQTPNHPKSQSGSGQKGRRSSLADTMADKLTFTDKLGSTSAVIGISLPLIQLPPMQPPLRSDELTFSYFDFTSVVQACTPDTIIQDDLDKLFRKARNVSRTNQNRRPQTPSPIMSKASNLMYSLFHMDDTIVSQLSDVDSTQDLTQDVWMQGKDIWGSVTKMRFLGICTAFGITVPGLGGRLEKD